MSSSRSNDQSSSAASMIRRFREGKPTSKHEREAARGDVTGEKEMWWVEKENRTNDATSNNRTESRTENKADNRNENRNENRTDYRSDNRASDRTLDRTETFGTGTDEFEPRGAPKAALKQTRPHSEILERLRQPLDYMSMTANKRFSMDRSVNVDEMIEREIRGLEKEMNIGTRRSSVRNNSSNNYDRNDRNDRNRTSMDSIQHSEYEVRTSLLVPMFTVCFHFFASFPTSLPFLTPSLLSR